MMERSTELILLVLVFLGCAAFTIGLTFAPCFSSLCSEDFYAYATRLHIASFYGIVASIASFLLLRASSPLARSVSEYTLTRHELPILRSRISVGGLAVSFWIISLTVATVGFWYDIQFDFWGLRTVPLHWADAQLRLAATGVTGHQADILLGLVIIPVGRNSLLGRVFGVHQSTLLLAHKLLAYILTAAVFAHGAATYTFVATYAAAKGTSPRKDAFNVDNPTETQEEVENGGQWHAATLPTGMFSFIFIGVIVITALPTLRRINYNTFYYTHIICSVLVFIAASFHASTDFYFLLPGLLLWVYDWAWRAYRGSSGLWMKVDGKLEDAENGWYRIILPVASKFSRTGQSDSTVEKQLPWHPLQVYYLNIPTISKSQNHAFTVSKIGSSASGPEILLRKAYAKGKTKTSKLEKEWTWKLAAAAVSNTPTVLPMRVEGPYFPAESTGVQAADHVVCLTGGTGITGAHSLALWWLEHRSSDPKAMLSLVWTVRERETAILREWQQLIATCSAQAPGRTRFATHISSGNGRLDVAQTLQQELMSLPSAENEKELLDCREKSAWIYISGPDSLLRSAEDACADFKRNLRRRGTLASSANSAADSTPPLRLTIEWFTELQAV